MNTGNKNIDLAISIGVIILLAFIVKKLIGFIQNPLSIPDESGGTSDTTADPNFKNITHPVIQFNAWCDTIADIIWGSGTLPSLSNIYMSNDEQDKIVFLMKQANNLDDVMAFIKIYGKRGRGIVLQDYPNLIQTLTQYLKQSDLDAINYDYGIKGIPYQF